MASFALGKYIPYKTPIHRMDPRVKVLGMIFLMVAVFFSYSTFSMTFSVMGAIALFIIVIMIISKTSFLKLLRSLKSLWFMIIFLLIIYVVVPKNDVTEMHVAFAIKGYNFYWESFLDAARILLRLVLMIGLSMVLTATTSPLDLTYALEWYMTPLKVIGFPAHIIAMTISLALRFIPTILEDVNRIMKAQTSRGVDFEHGGFGKKIKAIISLIIPLFVSAFIRSDELANAMECRGYDPNGKRTKYRKMHFKWSDALALVVVAAILGGCIYMKVINFDLFNILLGEGAVL
ncbi:MAG: energy-coupling factor transporter transmembrane protein EcfT [Bacilli bacterium]|nr:energy-coupling factor transporter transmembrane protein EcfT [Bacilli bacterium]